MTQREQEQRALYDQARDWLASAKALLRTSCYDHANTYAAMSMAASFLACAAATAPGLDTVRIHDEGEEEVSHG